MKRKRISGAERKAMILDEGKYGFDGARTQDIARAVLPA